MAKWIALIMRLLKMLFSGSKVSFYTPVELSQSSVINKKNVECVYHAEDQQECFKHLAQDTESWRNIESEDQVLDDSHHHHYQSEEELILCP
jgi:hypothetical protein